MKTACCANLKKQTSKKTKTNKHCCRFRSWPTTNFYTARLPQHYCFSFLFSLRMCTWRRVRFTCGLSSSRGLKPWSAPRVPGQNPIQLHPVSLTPGGCRLPAVRGALLPVQPSNTFHFHGSAQRKHLTGLFFTIIWLGLRQSVTLGTRNTSGE